MVGALRKGAQWLEGGLAAAEADKGLTVEEFVKLSDELFAEHPALAKFLRRKDAYGDYQRWQQQGD